MESPSTELIPSVLFSNITSRLLRLSIFFLSVIPLAFPARSQAQQDSFATVGIHPGAAAQSTVTGRIIAALSPMQGRLYAGYGDYGANTGPIGLYVFDPSVRTFTKEWDANTEAIYVMRSNNGRIYAPAIDRKSYAVPGDYTMRDTNGRWADYNFTGAASSTHVYDVGYLSDTEIFMAGSQDVRSTVWRSTNGGQNWKIVRTDTAISGKADDFARYYFLGVLQGRVYVQAMDYHGSLHPYSEVWDGSKWERGGSLFGTSTFIHGKRPIEFAGKLVLTAPQYGSPNNSGPLRVFDGVQGSHWQSKWVFDLLIDSNYLYALVDSGFGVIKVERTTDLETWQSVARAPLGSRSLAIMNDRIYVGTADSRILEYTSTIGELPLSAVKLTERSSDVQLYPNPCGDLLTVMTSAPPHPVNASVSIFDCLGRCVLNGDQHLESGPLDVSLLTPGIYRLQLRIGSEIITKQFVKR